MSVKDYIEDDFRKDRNWKRYVDELSKYCSKLSERYPGYSDEDIIHALLSDIHDKSNGS